MVLGRNGENMWVDHTLKVPEDGHWYAVVRVDENGNTETVTYLSTVTDADIIATIDAKNRTVSEP